MEEFQEHVYLFKNYLKDFSSLNKRELVNIKSLDELMIWVALLGFTREVYKKFKTLYPKYEQESAYSYRAIIIALNYTRRINYEVGSNDNRLGGSACFGGGGGSFDGAQVLEQDKV